MLAISYACDKTDSTATPQSVQWENLSVNDIQQLVAQGSTQQIDENALTEVLSESLLILQHIGNMEGTTITLKPSKKCVETAFEAYGIAYQIAVGAEQTPNTVAWDYQSTEKVLETSNAYCLLAEPTHELQILYFDRQHILAKGSIYGATEQGELNLYHITLDAQQRADFITSHQFDQWQWGEPIAFRKLEHMIATTAVELSKDQFKTLLGNGVMNVQWTYHIKGGTWRNSSDLVGTMCAFEMIFEADNTCYTGVVPAYIGEETAPCYVEGPFEWEYDERTKSIITKYKDTGISTSFSAQIVYIEGQKMILKGLLQTPIFWSATKDKACYDTVYMFVDLGRTTREEFIAIYGNIPQ